MHALCHRHPAVGAIWFLRSLVLSAATVAVYCLSAQADDPVEARVSELIRQLGSADFEQREKASKDLISLGAGALAQLRQAAHSLDPEVARRAVRAVAQIEKNQQIAALVQILQ